MSKHQTTYGDTIHVFEDSYYLIGNKATTRNLMFIDEGDQVRFLKKVDQCLSPLCDILAYGLGTDEFQLVVELKPRSEIEKYYLKKHGPLKNEDDFIPKTHYIFAQAMANMQSGYVKYHNYKHNKDGGMMCGRFTRDLIMNEEELLDIIDSVNNLNSLRKRKRAANWAAVHPNKFKGMAATLKLDESRSSFVVYGRGGKKGLVVGMKCVTINDVRGRFGTLPPKSISFANTKEKVQNLVKFILLNQ